MKKPLLLAAISLAAILLLAGCGGGGSTAAEAGASAQQAAEAEAAEVATATETNETAEESDLGGSLEADGTSGDKLPQRSSEPAAVSGSPTVYFTSDISAEGLVRIYEALGWTPSGNRNWMEPSWSATQPTADPAPVLPCTGKWRKTMGLRRLRILT